jgi:hypothetical protein
MDQGHSEKGIHKTSISINSWILWCVPVIQRYAEGWDQEDWISRSDWEKHLQDSFQWWYVSVLTVTAGNFK